MVSTPSSPVYTAKTIDAYWVSGGTETSVVLLDFPNVSGYAVWHVAPEFLEITILHGLLDELATRPTPENRHYSAEVLREIELRRETNRKEAQTT